MSRHRRQQVTVGALVVLAVLAGLILPLVGETWISPSALLNRPSSDLAGRLLCDIRIPRVLLAFLAGAALSMSGMAFQAMFRNPLATPFTLGVSSGAALGAAVSVHLGVSFAVLGFGVSTLCAFGGAMLSVALVYGLTRLCRGFSTSTMLLAGVAVNFFFASLILFLQYLSDFTESFRIVRWLMGSLSTVRYGAVLEILPFALGGSAIVFWLTHELNLLSTGDDIAAGRGVAVARTKRLIFFAASLMVGAVVAFCGPIGFVGMMVPHICRLMLGSNHRFLAPASFFLGGTFLALCDTIARTVIAPVEIPVGIITALLGGPFFVWLLVAGRQGRTDLAR